MSTDNTSIPRIVVGTDGSSSSIEALRWASRLSPCVGATIDVIAAWQYPSLATSGLPSDYRPDEDAKQIVADTVTAAFGATVPAGLREMTTQGAPAAVLTRASVDAEMLIVGSRGHGGFVGLMLGSVGAQCAEHSHCPILIVHDRTKGKAS